MLKGTDFKVNEKYYIETDIPYLHNVQLRIIINCIQLKSREELVDYITFTTLPSSKDLIDECQYNKIAIPISYIKKKETLKEILNNILIDDIIYLIEQYI